MAAKRTFESGKPWYREPWPWIIIGLLGTVMVASAVTFWIAVANPDTMVLDDAEYRQLRSELRAQESPDTASPARTSGEDD